MVKKIVEVLIKKHEKLKFCEKRMVLRGIEPMTMRRDAWQKALKTKQATTGPTRLGCLVDHDTR